MAEVYAGFLSHADHELGRLLDYLEASGELDNTIIVLVSDNGASGEGGPNGSVNENKFFNGIPDSIEENLKLLDELGGTTTYNHYPTGWAWAFNTPFKLWKRYANFEGGTADPLIVAWPKGFKAAGEYRRQYTHAIDIVPTLYECLGVELPDVVNGYTQIAARRGQLQGDLRRRRRGRPARRRSSTRCSGRARSGTRAGRRRRRSRRHRSRGATSTSSAGSCTTPPPTRARCHDLAGASIPDKLQELIALWWAEAGANQALPLESRGAIEILGTARPELSSPRTRYVYYPGGAEIPESIAPNIRNRSYTIAVEVDIDVARGRRRALLAGLAVRRARPLRQGRPAHATSTTSSASGSRSIQSTRADPDRARRPLGDLRAAEPGRCRPRAR